jgi:hypothetical protein
LNDEEDNEVPPILVQKRYGNVIFEKNKRNPYIKIHENYYPYLNLRNVDYLLNSEEA